MSGKQRYQAARFAAKRFAAGKWTGAGSERDFMHGTLAVFPTISGAVKVSANLFGDVKLYPTLRGEIGVNT
jgi:hypothetical protein